MLAAASIHTLVLMADNRYFIVVKPSKYRRYLSFKWVQNAFSSIQVLLLWFIIDSGTFAAFLVAVYVEIPSCIIFYCYFRIFKTIRSLNNNLSHPGNGTSIVNLKKQGGTHTICDTGVFSLFWTPVLLIDIVDTIPGRWTFPREAYVAYTFLANISRALNPFIYGVLNKNFCIDDLKICWEEMRMLRN